jgi:hypothetical protein
MAEAAGADEVDAGEPSERHVPSFAVVVAGERGGHDQGSCERGEQSQSEEPETHAA